MASLITSYVLGIFVIVTLIHTLLNTYVMWLYKRKEVYAVITKKDSAAKIVKINPHKDHFKIGKAAYIIPSKIEPYELKIGNKKYVRYIENTPAPHRWWIDEKPEIPGDVFHSILEGEGLKLLNKPPFAANMLTMLIIGGIVVIIIVIFMNRGT